MGGVTLDSYKQFVQTRFLFTLGEAHWTCSVLQSAMFLEYVLVASFQIKTRKVVLKNKTGGQLSQGLRRPRVVCLFTLYFFSSLLWESLLKHAHIHGPISVGR